MSWTLSPFIPMLLGLGLTFATRWTLRRARATRGPRAWAWRALAAPLASLGILALVATAALGWFTHRPRPRAETVELFQGVTYDRVVRDDPRPLVVHVVTVDLRAEGVRLIVTPPKVVGGRHLGARKTSDFLEEFGVQIAVNANYFYPFHTRGPWDYYPHEGDPVDVVGVASSRGSIYSTEPWKGGTLFLTEENRPSFDRPIGTPYNAIEGEGALLRDGRPLGPFGDDLNARVGLGVDEDGRRLILVVVDGKQPNYSEGATLGELATLLRERGAVDALRLDEGGSATLAASNPDGKARLLNSPINSRIPGVERPVANHLGIYARPLPRPR